MASLSIRIYLRLSLQEGPLSNLYPTLQNLFSCPFNLSMLSLYFVLVLTFLNYATLISCAPTPVSSIDAPSAGTPHLQQLSPEAGTLTSEWPEETTWFPLDPGVPGQFLTYSSLAPRYRLTGHPEAAATLIEMANEMVIELQSVWKWDWRTLPNNGLRKTRYEAGLGSLELVIWSGVKAMSRPVGCQALQTFAKLLEKYGATKDIFMSVYDKNEIHGSLAQFLHTE